MAMASASMPTAPFSLLTQGVGVASVATGGGKQVDHAERLGDRWDAGGACPGWSRASRRVLAELGFRKTGELACDANQVTTCSPCESEACTSPTADPGG